MMFCRILLGYIYFSNSFIFVSPSKCLWNYFTTIFEYDDPTSLTDIGIFDPTFEVEQIN